MKLHNVGFQGLLYVAVITPILLLAACSGGDGGGTPTVTYTGVTTPAAVDSQEAAIYYASIAVGGTVAGPDNMPLFGVGNVSGGASTVERLRSLADTVMRLDYASAVSGSTPVGATVSGSEQGCTGSVSLTITYTDVDSSGTFTAGDLLQSATATFTNFREQFQDGSCDTYTYNGATSINFLYQDPADSTLLTGLTMSSSYLSVTDATGATERLNGSFTVSIYPIPDVTLTLTADYQDTTGSVYRAKDYTVVISLDGITSVDGILCDPVRGCIEIVTNPVLAYDGATCPDGQPISGVITIYGYDWSAGTRTSNYITVDAGADAAGCTDYQVCWTGTTAGCVTPDPTW